jgi:hypothetical protein
MRDPTSRLLARGGRAFGLAAIAHARGRRAGLEPWHLVSRDLAAAADQILAELEAAVPDDALAAAIGAAMGEAPATAEPSWTAALLADPEAFARVGSAAAASWPASSPFHMPDGDRERGIAAVAFALCRSIDSARALAAKLGAEDGVALVRAARLCGAIARPGEPSAMRAIVRTALEEGGTVGPRD